MNDFEPFTRLVFGLPAVLGDLRFPLPLVGVDDVSGNIHDLRNQLHDYLLPRLAALDAPLLAVVGGSTGAGKSTLVNTLVGRVVTAPGVLRPTTRAPVLVHHPSSEMWFNSDRILPGLIRSQAPTASSRSLQLVPDRVLPTGLALLDAPDIDSIDDDNRELAAALLAAADLWIFVTSAARYADAVPWYYLKQAAERGTSVAVVCDRIPESAIYQVPAHLRQLMAQSGLIDSPLFTIPETTVNESGLLPDHVVAPIRNWLAALAYETASRQRVIRQTLIGTVRSIAPKLDGIATAIDDQHAAINQLAADVDNAFAQASRNVAAHSGDGTLLRGEVLARWQDFAGTGEFMRALERKISWVKDRIVGPLRAYSPEADEVQDALSVGLESLVREEGIAACERAELAWRGTPGGRFVVEHIPGLGIPSAVFEANVAQAIRDWRADVLSLVEHEGRDRRTRARFLALGVNGMGAALIVFLFAASGGITGAELGVASGASVLAQRLLEAVFGDSAVRTLARRAKDLLEQRVDDVLAVEQERFIAALRSIKLSDITGDDVRQIADDLADAVPRSG